MEIIEYSNVDTLIIKSNNDIFNGKYELLFAQDSEGLIHAKLISQKTLILIQKVKLGIGLD